MNRVTLITGGARSGKSSHALELASGFAKKAFLATAVPFDTEMKDRIGKHQSDRDGTFITVEEPVDLAGAIMQLPADIEVAIVDCLTIWLNNLMHDHGAEQDTFAEIESFLAVLKDPPCDLIIVANEVGMGIHAENEGARKFADLQGWVNQYIAKSANTVYLMVSGIPLKIK